MPTYSYHCNACDWDFDKWYDTMHTKTQPRCPRCDARNTERVYDAPNIQFVGNGFYVNDKGSKHGKG